MPSYRPSAASRVLSTLRDRRLDGERQAEQELVRTLAILRAAEAESARLTDELDRARRAYEEARAAAVPDRVERAAEAQARGRFRARLEAARQAAEAALEAHRTGPLAEAVRAAEAARAALAAAHNRRELVDRAIERRAAAEARLQSRRAEAEQDDRPAPRRV